MPASKKTWKIGEDAKAGMQVGADNAVMSAETSGEPNLVHVDSTGVYIQGKQSWMTMPEQIRVAGFWTQNTVWMQMLPSTMASPIPNLILNPPIKSVEDILESVAILTRMLL